LRGGELGLFDLRFGWLEPVDFMERAQHRGSEPVQLRRPVEITLDIEKRISHRGEVDCGGAARVLPNLEHGDTSNANDRIKTLSIFVFSQNMRQWARSWRFS
jgi:hypothetical protein